MYTIIFLVISSLPGFFLAMSRFSDEYCIRAETTESTSDNKTLIRLDTKLPIMDIINDITKYKTYEWDVTTESLHDNNNAICNFLPCYLVAWESMNMLKHDLMHLSDAEMTGTLLVLNNELIQDGIIYTIFLDIKNENDDIIESTCIRLERDSSMGNTRMVHKIDIPTDLNSTQVCSNDDCNESEYDMEKEGCNRLYLIGPYRISASNRLIINAFVVGNSANAIYQWKSKEFDDDNYTLYNISRSQLEIPAWSLETNKTYEILCELLQNGDVILSETHIVYVIIGEITLRLPFTYLNTGPNMPIKIEPLIEVPETCPYEVTWSCTIKGYYNSPIEDCKTYNISTSYNGSILYYANGLPKLGLYFFELKVHNIGHHDKLVVNISVVANDNRPIEVEPIPAWITSSDSLKLITRVHNMHTGCLVKWESTGFTYNKERYEDINLNNIDTKLNQVVFIGRDSFLYELTNHSRTTETRTFVLDIPSDIMSATVDVNYLIEFEAACVGFTSYIGVEIAFDAPPSITLIQLKPLLGDALFTLFKFEVMGAFDDIHDLPFTYTFGWTTYDDNLTENIMYFITLQDFHMIETRLPYIAKSLGSLQSVVKICDNINACNIIFGQQIVVRMPEEVSQKDHMTLKEQLVLDMLQNDYEKFSIDLHIVMPTYKELDSPYFHRDMQETANNLISQEIKLFLSGKKDKTDIHRFISSLSSVSEVLKFFDNVIKDLMKLRAFLVNEQMSAKIVTADEEALEVIENVNEQDSNTVTLEDIQKYFEASEFIITTSEDDDLVETEKNHFIANLEKHLDELCGLLYKDSVKNYKFNLKTSYIIVEKFTNNYFRNNFYVPNIDNQWQTYMQIRLNQSLFMDIKDKSLCIGKAVLQNYMDQEGFIYFAKLLSSNLQPMTMVNISNTVTKVIKNPDKFICSTYYQNEWHQCRRGTKRANHLVCTCNKMGFYKIDDLESSGDKGGNEGGNNDDDENPSGIVTTKAPVTQGNDVSNSGGDGNNGGNNSGDRDNDGESNGNNNNNNNGGKNGSNNGGSNGGDHPDSSGTTVSPNSGNEEGNGDSSNNGSNNENGVNDDNSATTLSPKTGNGESNGDNGNNGGNNGNNNNNNGGNNGSNNGGNNGVDNPDSSGTTVSPDSNDGEGNRDSSNNGSNYGSSTGNDGISGGNYTTSSPEIDNEGSNGNNGNNGGNNGNNNVGDGSSSNNNGGNNGGGSGNSGNNGSNNGSNNGADNPDSSGTTVSPDSGDGEGNGDSSNNVGNNESTTANDDNSGGSDSTLSPEIGNGGSNGDNGNNEENNGSNNGDDGGSPNSNGGYNGSRTDNGGNNGSNNGNNNGDNSGGSNTTPLPESGDNDGNGSDSNGGNNGGATNNGGNNGSDNNGENSGTSSPETGNRDGNDGSNNNEGGNNDNNATTPPRNGDGESNDNDNDQNNSGQPDIDSNDENGSNNGNGNPSQIPTDTTMVTPSERVTEPLGPDDDDIDNIETEGAGNSDTNNGDQEPGDQNDNETTPGNGENHTGNENNGGNDNNNYSSGDGTTPSGRTDYGSDTNTGEDNENGNNNSNGISTTTNPDMINTNSESMTTLSENNNNRITTLTSGNSDNDDSNNIGNDGAISTRSTSPTITSRTTVTTTTTPTTTTTTAMPTTTPPHITTSDIRTAGIGSSVSLGDQISFAVIGLCILGTGGLVLFGLISKRVRRNRPVEEQPRSFPMYADIFQKENMHGDFHP